MAAMFTHRQIWRGLIRALARTTGLLIVQLPIGQPTEIDTQHPEWSRACVECNELSSKSGLREVRSRVTMTAREQLEVDELT